MQSKKLKSKDKLVDSFLFYNEIDLLKTRLEYYGELVDYFVIVEADTDFSGKKKSFLLNDNLISTLPYASKIIVRKIKLNFNSIFWIYKKIRYQNNKKKFLWKIQDFQRNALLPVLKNFSDNDIIMFGDLDEFPSFEAISFYLHDSVRKVIVCNQLLFYYNLKTLVSNGYWNGTILLRKSHLRKNNLHKVRGERNNLPFIQNGGWHFSYFMPPNMIKNKIESFAIVEDLTDFLSMDKAEILKKISFGVDLYNRNLTIISVDITDKYIDKKLVNIINKNMPYLDNNLR